MPHAINIVYATYPELDEMQLSKVQRNQQRRENKSIKIDDEIEVIPEFRDIFTGKYYLLGNKGRTIKELRTDHKAKKKKYAKRKTFDIKADL